MRKEPESLEVEVVPEQQKLVTVIYRPEVEPYQDFGKGRASRSLEFSLPDQTFTEDTDAKGVPVRRSNFKWKLLKLVPGANLDVPMSLINAVLAHPQIGPQLQKRMDWGAVKIHNPMVAVPQGNTTDYSPEIAKDMVQGTYSLITLETWYAKEPRPEVMNAIQMRINDLKAGRAV